MKSKATGNMLQFGKQSLYNMLKPIKTEDEYNDALACTYELMQTDLIENSAASDEMEILSLLIKEYELVHYPVA